MTGIEHLKIRPYARLLTMLGEQLIKNERIALMELIKNSYDADADWVKISFLDFGENYKIQKESRIVIEDSGHGMTMNIIKNHWLNPATPEKKNRKSKKDTTEKGRILQGEKGIGRFSILKLGRVITIITRAKDEESEHVVEYDFSLYDDDFLTHNNKEKELFLDDLSVSVSSRTPQAIVAENILLGSQKSKRVPYGTRIEISNLKGSWTESKVKNVSQDISRLQPIFGFHHTDKDDFQVLIYKDTVVQNFHEEYLEKLHNLL